MKSSSSSLSVPIRAAIYARVSSDRQAQDQTIGSQVAALRERPVTDTRWMTPCAFWMTQSADRR